MVKLGAASLWPWGLLAAVEVGGSFAQASDTVGGVSGAGPNEVVPGDIVPGAFIVEYEDNVNIDAETAAIEGVAETRMKLDFELFKGVSIRFEDVETADTQAAALIETNKAVKNVWPVMAYGLPEYTIHWTGNDEESAQAAAAQKARQSSTDTFSTHVMTQVDRLRAQGVDGKGIKVAVIDTGVDYLNPSLGGCFGEGCLVGFGYDLVGDDYRGPNTPVPDPDPMDCDGHGTHVSGTIAAQANNPWGIVGAATGVTLGMFRTFGCDGVATDDVLIAAYNMAYEAGADIITASIGSGGGWANRAWPATVSRIVERGVVCTISAGNDGEQGLFYPSGAADAKLATAVGSVDNSLGLAFVRNASYTTQGNDEEEDVTFPYTLGSPADWANVTDLPLYATSFDTTLRTDACDPLPDDTPDLSGYVVLIRRGTCTWPVKFQNARDKGARYVLIYNNVNFGLPQVDGSTVPGLVAAASVPAVVGKAWIASLAAGRNVTVSFTDPSTTPFYLISPENTDSGGFMSFYSSWSPTFELDVKPQVATPGGMIASTWLSKNGSYAVISGTSMACPLAAAIYALLMGARGTKDPGTLERLLSATARPNLYNNGSVTFPVLSPPIQQGAGLVQAYDAAHATTLLSASRLTFNDTNNFAAAQDFAIENTSNQTVTYTLRDVRAPTIYAFNGTSLYPVVKPAALDDGLAGASLAFDVANPFTIPAGGRKVVTVTCTPPAGLDAGRLPVYSGYVVLNGSDSVEGFSLPYMGVVGSMHAQPVLDRNRTYLSSSLAGDNDTRVAPGRTFLLPPPGASNDTRYQNATDFPVVQWALGMGTALTRIDLVPVSPVAPGTNVTESLGVQTLGDLFGTPVPYLARNQEGDWWSLRWDGQLASGAYAPEGSYRLAVRVLRIYGDRSDPADYEATETVQFSIKYMTNSTASALRRRAPGVSRGHRRGVLNAEAQAGRGRVRRHGAVRETL